MTREGDLRTSRSADTEVFYMAGRQLPHLGRRLCDAGWSEASPVCVVSRAGWPDELCSEHTLADLGQAALLHGGRPAVVTVGPGARKLIADAKPGLAASPAGASRSPPSPDPPLPENRPAAV